MALEKVASKQGMVSKLGRLGAFSGVAGLVVLIFGLLCFYLIENDIYHLGLIHFVVSAVLIVLFFLQGGIAALSSNAAKRSYSFSFGLLAYGLMFFGILASVNYLATQNELFHFDSTEQKVHSLAPQTEKVLEDLNQELVIRAFYLGGVISNTSVSSVLDRMTKKSPNLKLKIVDPEKQLIEAEKFGISENQTLHFSFSDPNLKSHAKIVGKISEQEIVNAILKLSRGKPKKVYYLTGHGEPDLSSESEEGYIFLKEAVEGENLSISELVITGQSGVPDDADALIIAAPKKALLVNEVEALMSYIKGGGDLILMFEPRAKSGLRRLLKPMGIEVGEDVVIEPVVKLFGGPGLGVQPLVKDYGAHVITQGFRDGTVFNIASSVRIVDLPKSASGAELAKTSASSWAEQDIEKIFEAEAPDATEDETDIPGPVSLAAAIEVNLEGKKSRLVSFGDSDFVNNISIRQLFNRDLFLNSLNWVLGEENRVSIRPRSLRTSVKAISASEFTMLFLLTGIILPELVALIGFFIYFKRK